MSKVDHIYFSDFFSTDMIFSSTELNAKFSEH